MLDLIETPRVSSENSEYYGKFVIEPLERGFGTTLGNSLRRVLLSSIVGSAVTHINIDGVLHEFSTIPGVVEDVTEIVLNIKKLRLDLLTEGPKTLRLDVKGEGIVTAADIQPDSEVEILNPEAYIAELTDKDSRLSMELVVNKGKGYVSAEKHNSEQILGMIPVDSIFSPVIKASYAVEDSRVGQVTNYDRLIIEIWTDGSILPYEALSESANIIREYMGYFTDLTPPQVGSETQARKPESEGEDRALDMLIEDLGLSVRSLNCLKRATIKSVRDLIGYSEEDLMKLKNFGQKSLVEIRAKLEQYGLSLVPSSKDVQI